MNIKVESIDPERLKAADYNPRTISEGALKTLARLMDEHGFIDPIIARREDRLVIGGHQRLRANALRERPDEKVPCIFLSGVSDERAKALNIALNNPAAQGRYDAERLSVLIEDLSDAELDVSSLTGFSEADLAELEEAMLGDLPAEPEPVRLDDESVDHGGVVVILEMCGEVYQSLKPTLDEWIAKGDLTCHVRFDNER